MRVLCLKVLVRNRDLRANEKNEYSSNKTNVAVHEFSFNFCFIAAILILFRLPVNCARKNSYEIVINGQKKMSMAAIKQKLKVNSCKVTFDLLLLYSLSRRPLWLVGWLKPLIKLPIGHQNGQKLVGPCINMWYMIPSDRRKFEQETKLNSTFRYFDDVILQKVWGLVYRWPRYFRLNRYDNFSMLIIWWRPWHPGHMLIHGPTRFWPVSCPIGVL